MINAITDYAYRERMYAEIVYPLNKLGDTLRVLHQRLPAHIYFYNNVTWDINLKDDTFIMLFQEGLNFMHTDLEGIVSYDLQQISSTYRGLLIELPEHILECMPEIKNLQMISDALMELAGVLSELTTALQIDNPSYLNVSATLSAKLSYLDIIVKSLDKTVDDILYTFSCFGLATQKETAKKLLSSKRLLKDIYGIKTGSFDDIKSNRITMHNT